MRVAADFVPATVTLVDVVLHDRGPDHGRTAPVKNPRVILSGVNLIPARRKAGQVKRSQMGVKTMSARGSRLERTSVRKPVGDHGGGLRDEVDVQLVVCEPCTPSLASPFDKPIMVRLHTVDREPAEHAARL